MIFNKKNPKNKISEMIMEYAGNFILEGEDEFEKQQRLNTSAPNFHVMRKGKRAGKYGKKIF